jgi:hypothetical protein
MLLLAASISQVSFTATDQMVVQKMSQMPLAFTKNMGQWDERVLFRANAGGATMWFTKEGVTYQFTRRIETGDDASSGHSRAGGNPVVGLDAANLDPRLRGDDMKGDSVEQLVLTAKFIDANPNPEVIAEGQMEYKCNYFLGNEPSKWHTDVPNYEAITLKDIYPGIDLKFSGDSNGQAAYEFIAAPDADIAQIKVEYEGAEETSIDAYSRLILKSKWGDLIASIESPANGVLSGTAGFSQLSEKALGPDAQGANQQALGSLAVGLVYSTYLGGENSDYGHGIAVDGSGNAYVTGSTGSSNFPTLDPYQTHQGNGDAFVTKFSSSGNSLIYSTYLGGVDGDLGDDIAVDGSGNVYLTGLTCSANFPTLNPFQTDQGNQDAFVAKIGAAGNSLIYSTYLGGADWDEGIALKIDGSGNVYVTGITWSSDFPTVNPIQTDQGGQDLFVTKISATGNSLIYSTYLGGGGSDGSSMGAIQFNILAVDDSGSAYVTGQTSSSDFPTQNPFQTYQGSKDAFVTKLSSSGSSLMYSTYLGGAAFDEGQGITVDSRGSVYVSGRTGSSDFPTLNPYQATFQGVYSDAFATKLSSSGDNLVYSTYLGGGDSEQGFGIAVDGCGNAYVTGTTRSTNFPVQNAYDTTLNGYSDAFLTKLSNSGNSLIYSTYLGGSGDIFDMGFAIAVDGAGNAYVTGITDASDFPTLNPYQTYRGSDDAFLTKVGAFPPRLCGDADANGFVNISDAVYLINYIFAGGPAPCPEVAGDADCNGFVNISDAVYLINYIFGGGPEPCAACK